jgi:mannose/fructose/N-acetylgalactosamine-specific phosphotransferase system component IIC
MFNKQKILQEIVLPASQVFFWVAIGGMYAALSKSILQRWPQWVLGPLKISTGILTGVGVVLLFLVMLRLFPILYKATQKFLEKL